MNGCIHLYQIEPPKRAANALEAQRTERELRKIFVLFVRAGIGITLTLGTAWGAYILWQIAIHQSYAAPNYAATQGHGHSQIYGWVGLFIMGVAYFSVPKFLNTRLTAPWRARLAFWLMLAGIVLRSVTQPLATRPVFGALVFASALLELAAAIFFAYDTGMLFARGRKFRTTYLRFIHGSVGWFLVMAGWNVWLVLPLALGKTNIVADPANGRFLYVAIFGFAGNMILGYSLRLMPILLGLRRTRQAFALPSFLVFNAGILARIFGWNLVSGVLTLCGALLFLWTLRIFEPAASYAKTRGIDESFPWYVRVSYAWLVVAVGMVLGGDVYAFVSGSAPAHMFVGSWRHAVTVGFITTIIVGLGYRLMPMFLGVDLWRPRWMRPAFALLVTGNLMRVMFELMTASEQRWAYLAMGASGILELTALTLFGISIWITLGKKQVVLVSAEQIAGTTHVRWLLDYVEDSRAALISAGFHHLRNPEVQPPPGVTLEQAAAMHGLAVNQVVAQLRAALAAHLSPPDAASAALSSLDDVAADGLMMEAATRKGGR